mmetsp:Transcript_26427/g.60151  ORF Transcript_26427/g.60151 Transcript_26427/m.60151 type:complete len:145 (-) Transcript_26427:947-1381(-)
MADKAKKALESIGICRPPTSRVNTQGSHADQTLHMDEGGGEPRSDMLILSSDDHSEVRSISHEADLNASPLENTVSSDPSFSDGRTWKLTGRLQHLETSWEETPRSNVDAMAKPRTSNLSPADSEMWEKELDELLEWTDQLCSL